MTPFASSRSRLQLGWLALGLAWLVTALHAVSGFTIGDEWVHWQQIRRFVQGDYRIFEEYLTNVPGYHWLLAGLLMPFDLQALGWSRAVTAVMSLASAWLFHRIRLQLHPADAQRATAQFFFLPTMFIYGYMAYTDVPALMFLLGALLATLKGRHGISGLLLLASMAMRQNHVLWAVFLGVFASWPVLVEMARALVGGHAGRMQWKGWLVDLLGIVWPYVLVVGCFCLYWAINGSIAYSTAQSENAHPDFRLDIGNPVFLLAITALLFPLQIGSAWRRLVAFGSTLRGVWIWLLPLLLFGLYAGLFQVHHPFNFITDGNVRNQALQQIAAGGVAWWVFGLLASWAGAGLVFFRYALPQGWLWLPFSLLFVAASWMIETRYTIVPLVLLLALRRPESDWVERVTLGAWAMLSLWLAWRVFNLQFML